MLPLPPLPPPLPLPPPPLPLPLPPSPPALRIVRSISASRWALLYAVRSLTLASSAWTRGDKGPVLDIALGAKGPVLNIALGSDEARARGGPCARGGPSADPDRARGGSSADEARARGGPCARGGPSADPDRELATSGPSADPDRERATGGVPDARAARIAAADDGLRGSASARGL